MLAKRACYVLVTCLTEVATGRESDITNYLRMKERLMAEVDCISAIADNLIAAEATDD